MGGMAWLPSERLAHMAHMLLPAEPHLQPLRNGGELLLLCLLHNAAAAAAAAGPLPAGG